jgi:predicted nuclease with RNAse H fold
MAWFGADPGGALAFGVALLRPDGSFDTAVVSCADEAIAWLAKTGASIEAAGIDAPLWWSSGRTGFRKSDQRIRNGYDGLGSTVLSLNSLWGAALVQGVMMAVLLRERFGDVSITECHPKALLKAWGIDPTVLDASWKKTCERFALADGPSRKDTASH